MKEDSDDKESIGQMSSPRKIMRREYRQTNIQYFKYVHEVISAFCINWPYVTFSGLDMTLVIFNMYDKELVHRIQIAPKGVNMNICETFISDTKDLFALCYMD